MNKTDAIFNEYFTDYKPSEMLYNKLNYENFNIDEFNKKYTIVKLEYQKQDNTDDEKSYVDFEAKILNELAKEVKILSVSFTGGKVVYLLTKKEDVFSWSDYSNYKEYKDFCAKFCQISELTKYDPENSWHMNVLFNLLLNALAKRYSDFSNLNGKFYAYTKKAGSQIITMSFHAFNNALIRNQQSFIPYKYRDNSKNTREYIVQFGANNSAKVSRATKDNRSKDTYVKQSFKKQEVTYDQLTGIDDPFKPTRINVLHNLITNFNNEYDGIAKIEFFKTPVRSKRIKSVAKVKEEKLAQFKKLDTVNLWYTDKEVDKNNENIQYFIQQIENMGLKTTEISPKETSIPTIIFIHNEEYYEENSIEDEKLKSPQNIPNQCVTFENILGFSLKPDKKTGEIKCKDIDNIAFHTLNELTIKTEIFSRKIKRWTHGECEFYLGMISKSALGEEPIHLLMKIKEDGSFEIIEDIDKIDPCYTQHIYQLKKKNTKKFEFKDGNICIIRKGDNVNQIVHTDYMPIMDKESKEELVNLSIKKGNTTRCKKTEYLEDKKLYPYVGKTVMNLDNKLHYTVGLENEIGKSIAKLNNIYRIDELENLNGDTSNIIYEIFDMLEDYYVRSNSTETVRPYPFKYLIEYLRINNPGKELYLR